MKAPLLENAEDGESSPVSAPTPSADVKSLFSKTKKKIKSANVQSLPPPPPPAAIDYDASTTSDEGWEREYQRLDTFLNDHGLRVERVDADGACMFSSVALHFPGESSDSMRAQAVSYMLAHPDDFAPFVDIDAYPNGFTDYCVRMRMKTTWGGQLELQALSQARQVNLYVFQTGDKATVKMINFDPSSAQCVTVSYHDGEHYNCVLPNSDREGILTVDGLEEMMAPEMSERAAPPSYMDNNAPVKIKTKKKSLFN